MNAPIRIVVAIIAASLLGAMCLACAGCGGPAYEYDSVVSGTVTIDGELAPSGTITFHPIAKGGKIAIGRIYPDGSFSLRTGQGDLRESDGGTVVPGEYIVTVVVTGPPPASSSPEGGPPSSGPLLIDERYLSRETSDLRCTIKPGQNVIVFPLDRAKPAAEQETEEASDDATPSSEDGNSESEDRGSSDTTIKTDSVESTVAAPSEGEAP